MEKKLENEGWVVEIAREMRLGVVDGVCKTNGQKVTGPHIIEQNYT